MELKNGERKKITEYRRKTAAAETLMEIVFLALIFSLKFRGVQRKVNDAIDGRPAVTIEHNYACINICSFWRSKEMPFFRVRCFFSLSRFHSNSNCVGLAGWLWPRPLRRDGES